MFPSQSDAKAVLSSLLLALQQPRPFARAKGCEDEQLIDTVTSNDNELICYLLEQWRRVILFRN
jgi:hypothetical protein